ncbi:MAG: thioredoxin domain-containing protein [Patescibacteria group bacterium]|nr:DsbA family protein [Patescibacteria group bacterium]
MIKSFFKDKRITSVFMIVFILILTMIVFAIYGGNKIKRVVDTMSPEEVASVVEAGNFLADGLRGMDNSDIILGKKNAKIKVIVYEDLSSYYSAEFDETLDLIRREVGDDVAIAFRPYADKMFSNSVSVNLWSQCANEQGKFFEARDLLLDEVKKDSLSVDYLGDYGQKIGLNQGLIDDCLNKEKYLPRLEKIKSEAERFDVYGVPTIFVDNEMIVGARSFNDTVNNNGEKLEGMRNIIYRHLN